mmetsp:Transcript_32873/g.65157  ORF Transcript_32873/g.65157 Transcript_32873/m.65157 type:complete len:277 (+) Transcript_32873:126-956(+)
MVARGGGRGGGGRGRGGRSTVSLRCRMWGTVVPHGSFPGAGRRRYTADTARGGRHAGPPLAGAAAEAPAAGRRGRRRGSDAWRHRDDAPRLPSPGFGPAAPPPGRIRPAIFPAGHGSRRPPPGRGTLLFRALSDPRRRRGGLRGDGGGAQRGTARLRGRGGGGGWLGPGGTAALRRRRAARAHDRAGGGGAGCQDPARAHGRGGTAGAGGGAGGGRKMPGKGGERRQRRGGVGVDHRGHGAGDCGGAEVSEAGWKLRISLLREPRRRVDGCCHSRW